MAVAGFSTIYNNIDALISKDLAKSLQAFFKGQYNWLNYMYKPGLRVERRWRNRPLFLSSSGCVYVCSVVLPAVRLNVTFKCFKTVCKPVINSWKVVQQTIEWLFRDILRNFTVSLALSRELHKTTSQRSVAFNMDANTNKLSTCEQCSQIVQGMNRIRCEGFCNGMFHASCVKMSREDLLKYNESPNMWWMCDSCSNMMVNQRNSRQLLVKVTDTEVSATETNEIARIDDEIAALKEQITAIHQSISSSAIASPHTEPIQNLTSVRDAIVESSHIGLPDTQFGQTLRTVWTGAGLLSRGLQMIGSGSF